MNKIIFLIIAIILSFGNPGKESFAQKESKNFTDTLLVGGFYRVTLTNGKQYMGEITDKTDSTIDFNTELENFRLVKDQIKSLIVAKSDFDEGDIEEYKTGGESKFKFLSSFQAGINNPAGNFGESYKTGFGIQASVFHMFDRTIGFGAELQYANFPGSSRTTNEFYIVTSTLGNYNLLMLKMNFVAGNFNPKNKIVAYGLFGLGIQYYTEGDETVSRTYHDLYLNTYSTYEEKHQGSSGVSFMYGIGAGAFYKVSRQVGINCEFQFNKIPETDSYNYYYYYSTDDLDGFFSIKAGIIYTVF